MKKMKKLVASMGQGLDKNQLVSLQHSIETRLKELQMKETHINNSLKKLQSKKEEMGLVQERLEERERMVELKENRYGGNAEFDCSLWSMVSLDGPKLLLFLNEYVDEQEKLHDGIYRALEVSDDPAKMVLDAVKEFYLENGELGLSVSVRKRSCVILLEQLTRLRPNIVPKVKAEAARLAREWRAKIKMEDEQKGVLEVMGFLLLLGAYDLVDVFDIGEMWSVFECIGQQHKKSSDSPTAVDLADKDTASIVLDSQVKVSQSLKETSELGKGIAFSFTSPSDALNYFCVGMDGRSLRLFLYEHVEEQDSLCNEVRDALIHAPDPAKLVLDATPGFLRSQPEFDKGLSLAKVRKSCILLLEQLMTISPQISPNLREEASKIADEWNANLGQKFQRPVTVYGFLLFIAAYGFTSGYEADELLGLFVIATQYKPSPALCRVLGLADKVEVIIQTLIQKTLLLEAIENMYAYQVVDKFQPVRLLKGYLNYSKKRISKKGNKSLTQQVYHIQGIDKEISVLRTVVKYITKYKLESKYPPENLEKQIVQLEKQKMLKKGTPQKVNGKASTSSNSQVKVEPSSEEDLRFGYQMTSLSTSPWPQLEAFCISEDGKGLSFPPCEHREEHDSMSSSSDSPWPELKSFCVNMEGRNLRSFLYKHIEGHDSICSEVYDALQFASDPAKLVLEAIPGIFRSQPEFDKSLSLNKVRKSCILLLEQLLTIAPEISSHVKEEALLMANDWRANLGQKYQNHVIVYGFLHFLAAYGLHSDYKADELLDLLATANQYKVSLAFCQILGLADKVIVLIKNLLQKNLILEAIEHIYAFEVFDKFEAPVRLLKGYLSHSKKMIYKKGTKPLSKKAIDKEIAAVRSVIQCIAKFELESEYPPEDLENQIVELEIQKLRIM